LSGKGEHNILVVDDDRSMREFLEIMLSREGYQVEVADSGERACRMLDKRAYDLVVTDIRMKDVDGIEVLKKAKLSATETMVILISAFATAETAVEAMKQGAYDYIPKPFKVDEFKKIIREALAGRKAAPGRTPGASGPDRRLHFDLLIGESPQMHRVYDLIEKVAGNKSNILISGESGTGKELVARAIHRLSQRRDKPFVAINCAGIPESLIESELFGYRKGAFTGAHTDKEGFFDVADGGTVFLDEVGELTPAIQVKLLRVIQEKAFTALGGTEEKNVDVRFISATNKDLEREVMNKGFREDLYFRLNVIHIPVPPLRERDGDLQLLAQYFLEKFAVEFGKDIRKISAYAMDILQKYSFPGNVRELENIVERSAALETSNIVLPESLALSNLRAKDQERARRKTDLGPEGLDLEKIMAEIERDYILKALEMAQGSRQRAADLLGVNLRSLRYRMSKLGLS
jgi:two-component system response regulator PilR (NtrC family)